MIWARPSETVARVGFKPATLCVSPTQDRGAVLRHIPARAASRRLAVADVRDRDHSPSLSSDYKKRKCWPKLPFSRRFLPNAKVGTTVHLSSASHRLTPPLGNSSRLAHPRFLALLLP
jgi:hypothetical protein